MYKQLSPLVAACNRPSQHTTTQLCYFCCTSLPLFSSPILHWKRWDSISDCQTLRLYNLHSSAWEKKCSHDLLWPRLSFTNLSLLKESDENEGPLPSPHLGNANGRSTHIPRGELWSLDIGLSFWCLLYFHPGPVTMETPVLLLSPHSTLALDFNLIWFSRQSRWNLEIYDLMSTRAAGHLLYLRMLFFISIESTSFYDCVSTE